MPWKNAKLFLLKFIKIHVLNGKFEVGFFVYLAAGHFKSAPG